MLKMNQMDNYAKSIKGIFSKSDSGMQQKEFDIAAKKLINIGIVQEVKRNGNTYYQLTSLGEKLKSHFESDVKVQN